ncbi:hypothetical protein ACQ4WP_28320 [Janthinobacterium sp. GB4P2]|uniref:hypothetical protein n=1 Tax=Janthinobacterium sp. GB4P2 TaxID=3424189 RepID=UPI003F282484
MFNFDAIVQEALSQLPRRYKNYIYIEKIPRPAPRNISLILNYGKSRKVLKIFLPQFYKSELLPTAVELGRKESWVANHPELTSISPKLYYDGVIEIGEFVTSYILQEHISLPTADRIESTVSNMEIFSWQLGGVSKFLHQIYTDGYGSVLSHDRRKFSLTSWSDYLETRIRCSMLRELTDKGALRKDIKNEVELRILKIKPPSKSTLFHHDLLHNWGNVFIDPMTLQVKSIIDWEQCGSGASLTVELGAARFALHGRQHQGFGWKNFLLNFLHGYGFEEEEYRFKLMQDVNSFSLLYAAKKLSLNGNDLGCLRFIEDSLTDLDH